ncbi:hypothetical protein [Lysinibacter cavernae]|uniref:hypothetical protein n=1 Tax=Lysinibacter cavernae TaxID=1640652 RepID=UPI00360ACF2C
MTNSSELNLANLRDKLTQKITEPASDEYTRGFNAAYLSVIEQIDAQQLQTVQRWASGFEGEEVGSELTETEAYAQVERWNQNRDRDADGVVFTSFATTWTPAENQPQAWAKRESKTGR